MIGSPIIHTFPGLAPWEVHGAELSWCRTVLQRRQSARQMQALGRIACWCGASEAPDHLGEVLIGGSRRRSA